MKKTFINEATIKNIVKETLFNLFEDIEVNDTIELEIEYLFKKIATYDEDVYMRCYPRGHRNGDKYSGYNMYAFGLGKFNNGKMRIEQLFWPDDGNGSIWCLVDYGRTFLSEWIPLRKLDGKQKLELYQKLKDYVQRKRKIKENINGKTHTYTTYGGKEQILSFIEEMLEEHPNWEFVGKSNCGSGRWAACFREIE